MEMRPKRGYPEI